MRVSVYTNPAAAWTVITAPYEPGVDGVVLISCRWDDSTKVITMLIDGVVKNQSAVLTGETVNTTTNDLFIGSLAAATTILDAGYTNCVSGIQLCLMLIS